MTKQEIEKAAQEYAKSIGFKECHSTVAQLTEYAVEDFKAGVEFSDKHWQEKTRWKSLETEPPKFEGKKYQILIRHSPITHDVACIVSPRSVEFCIAKGYKYWKEIE